MGLTGVDCLNNYICLMI